MDRIQVAEAVNKIATILNRVQSFDDAVQQLIEVFIDFVGADQGAIQLLRPSSEATRYTLIREHKQNGNQLDQRLDRFLTGWVLKHKETLLTNDIVSLVERESAARRYSGIKSALAVPILSEEQIIGTVNLIRTQGTPFSDNDKANVSALASQVGEFIDGASLREQLFVQNERLREDLENRYIMHGIIGHSPAIKAVYGLLQQVIPTDARVVLYGESGTGKELIARCIHYAGPRKQKPFVAVDCGALPANLLESELFGAIRGAFTGANRDRRGLIEEANGGTLFLDEITNMTVETQVKLLRFIQEGEIRPLGSSRTRKVDVRIVVAASSNLSKQVEAGLFRPDLFYRLNVVSVEVPALRERAEDIPVLAELFLRRYSKKHAKNIRTIDAEAIGILQRYHWPGNIRELENVIERAVVITRLQHDVLKPVHLPDEVLYTKTEASVVAACPVQGNLADILAGYEREILRRALQQHNWNQSAAAKALNISEAVMRYKIKRLHLKD
jgi:transcriptional regulator with GAF, ATPase, and Fis domain